jgi:hypothetical protein
MVSSLLFLETDDPCPFRNVLVLFNLSPTFVLPTQDLVVDRAVVVTSDSRNFFKIVDCLNFTRQELVVD